MNLSQSFVENLIILAATALLTGFLIPFILKRIDNQKQDKQKEIESRRLRKQKEYEAELARQEKIIAAQVLLLENISQFLWDFQLFAISVSYYRGINEEQYDISLKRYNENVVSILCKIRAEISKSLRLVSHDIYQELTELYYKELLIADRNLMQLVNENRQPEEWYNFNQYVVYQLSQKVDNVINRIAIGSHLKSEEPSHGTT